MLFSLRRDGYFNPRSLTGATAYCLLSWPTIRNFNPRSLTGATNTLSHRSGVIRFQSTLPHGSDKTPAKSPLLSIAFQSTLPHGSDGDYDKAEIEALIFQSTLPHGSDTEAHARLIARTISIHAPSRERRGATLIFAYEVY